MKRRMAARASVLAGSIQLFFAMDPASAGELSLGMAAGQQTSLYRDLDDQTFVIPVIGYEGERFSYFLDTAAFKLADGQVGGSGWRVRAVATARIFDQPNRRAGLERRHSTVDVGLDAGARGAWGSLSVEVLTDALDRHEGMEAGISYAYDLQVTGKLTITPSIGLSYYDQELADYYFGVRSGEVRGSRLEYHPGSAGVATAGAMTTYALSEHWTLVGVAQVMALSDELADSPLVERRSSTTVVLGAMYRF